MLDSQVIRYNGHFIEARAKAVFYVLKDVAKAWGRNFAVSIVSPGRLGDFEVCWHTGSIARQFGKVSLEGGDRILLVDKLPHHTEHHFIVIFGGETAQLAAYNVALNQLEKGVFRCIIKIVRIYAQH